MDLKDCPKYDNQYRRQDRHHCYCKKCGEELYPYCIKHNYPIKDSHQYLNSCGAILCRQEILSYYSPSQGFKYCFYGQGYNCDRRDCVYSTVKYPKGCTYCRHPLCNGKQLFKCETPLETTPESPSDYFEIDETIKRVIMELYDEIV